jgi:hypothetical protein
VNLKHSVGAFRQAQRAFFFACSRFPFRRAIDSGCGRALRRSAGLLFIAPIVAWFAAKTRATAVRPRAFFALALLLTLGSTASAAPITISFDVDSDNNPLTAPGLFLETSPLRTLYSPLGVTFAGPGPDDGGAILDQSSNFDVNARSGRNFLAFNADAVYPSGGFARAPESLLFDPPISEASIYAGVGDSHLFRMDAFDANGLLVDTDLAGLGASSYVQLSVSGAAITRIELSAQKGDDEFVFDDLTFTPVPEPSTLALALLGALALALRRFSIRDRSEPNFRVPG